MGTGKSRCPLMFRSALFSSLGLPPVGFKSVFGTLVARFAPVGSGSLNLTEWLAESRLQWQRGDADGTFTAAQHGDRPMALVRCRDCGQDVSTDAKACPKCGSTKHLSWTKNPTANRIVGLVLLALFGWCGLRICSGDSKPSAPPIAQVLVPDSCYDMSVKFGPGSKLSDLQKEELWKSYKGKAFKWTLQITEVSSGVLGGYTVQAKCAPRSPSLIQDIQIEYPDEAKSYVMQFHKGQAYELKGTFTNTSTLLGLGADGG